VSGGPGSKGKRRFSLTFERQRTAARFFDRPADPDVAAGEPIQNVAAEFLVNEDAEVLAFLAERDGSGCDQVLERVDAIVVRARACREIFELATMIEGEREDGRGPMARARPRRCAPFSDSIKPGADASISKASTSRASRPMRLRGSGSGGCPMTVASVRR
jgi:hypothetical protein